MGGRMVRAHQITNASASSLTNVPGASGRSGGGRVRASP
jgi:hypothetical protein